MTRSEPVFTSKAEGFRTAEEIAAMRPMAAPRPRTRQAANPALRQVTNGIACFCGERFGESQALEFMLHLRAEVGEDLAVLERHRTYMRDYWRKRRAEDPEYRERERKYNREWRRHRAEDPEYRARRAARALERYHERKVPNPKRRCGVCGHLFVPPTKAKIYCSPECRRAKERENARNRGGNARKRERYANDPEYRERQNARNRANYARKRAEREAVEG